MIDCGVYRATAAGLALPAEEEMDEDLLGKMRESAQLAMSRARLSRDPGVKTRWAAVAQAWLDLIEAIEAFLEDRTVDIRRVN